MCMVKRCCSSTARSVEADINIIQLSSVAFESGEKMLFINSKLPCNTQACPKIVLQSSSCSYMIIYVKFESLLLP